MLGNAWADDVELQWSFPRVAQFHTEFAGLIESLGDKVRRWSYSSTTWTAAP